MSDLKACVCGSEQPVLVEFSVGPYNWKTYECPSCGLMGDADLGESGAAWNWNMAVLEETVKRQGEEIERMKGRLELAEGVCGVLAEYRKAGEFFDPETTQWLDKWMDLKGINHASA